MRARVSGTYGGIQNEYFGSTRWKLFWNWMNSRDMGSLADEAGPISNSLRLSWRRLTSGMWWRQEGWAKGHSFTPVGVTSAFPSAHNTTASGRGPSPGVLPPAGPRRVFLGTLALFQMI
ncbi:hypothetical protein THAOC_23653, partial [Thalassiosira oceanica]